MFKPRDPNAFEVVLYGRVWRRGPRNINPSRPFEHELPGHIWENSDARIFWRPDETVSVDSLKITAPPAVWVQSIQSPDFEHLCNALPADMFKGQAELIGSAVLQPGDLFQLVLVRPSGEA